MIGRTKVGFWNKRKNIVLEERLAASVRRIVVYENGIGCTALSLPISNKQNV